MYTCIFLSYQVVNTHTHTHVCGYGHTLCILLHVWTRCGNRAQETFYCWLHVVMLYTIFIFFFFFNFCTDFNLNIFYETGQVNFSYDF